MEQSTSTGAVPTALVWLTPACAAALRFAARLAGQVGLGQTETIIPMTRTQPRKSSASPRGLPDRS